MLLSELFNGKEVEDLSLDNRYDTTVRDDTENDDASTEDPKSKRSKFRKKLGYLMKGSKRDNPNTKYSDTPEQPGQGSGRQQGWPSRPA